jgi:hypothetical protein
MIKKEEDSIELLLLMYMQCRLGIVIIYLLGAKVHKYILITQEGVRSLTFSQHTWMTTA